MKCSLFSLGKVFKITLKEEFKQRKIDNKIVFVNITLKELLYSYNAVRKDIKQ